MFLTFKELFIYSSLSYLLVLFFSALYRKIASYWFLHCWIHTDSIFLEHLNKSSKPHAKLRIVLEGEAMASDFQNWYYFPHLSLSNWHISVFVFFFWEKMNMCGIGNIIIFSSWVFEFPTLLNKRIVSWVKKIFFKRIHNRRKGYLGFSVHKYNSGYYIRRG